MAYAASLSANAGLKQMRFQPGQSGNPAGSKPGNGAGRKPDWLINKCQTLVDDAKVVEFLAAVVKGEDVEQVVGDQGEVIRVPAAVRDKLRAAEMLLDRAYGKPGQPVTVTAESELESIPTKDLLEVFAAFPGGTYQPSEGRA